MSTQEKISSFEYVSQHLRRPAQTQDNYLSLREKTEVLNRRRVFIFKYSKDKKNKLKKKTKYIPFLWSDEIITEVGSMNYAQEYESIVLLQKNEEDSKPEASNLESLAEYFAEYLEKTKTKKQLADEEKKRIKPKISKEEKLKAELIEEKKMYGVAVDLYEKGYEKKYICSKLGIQLNKLNRAIYKKKHNLPQFPESKGRKTRISRAYIEYATKLLEEIPINECLFAENVHEKLKTNFPELNDQKFSLSTTQKIIKRAGFSFKRVAKRSTTALNADIDGKRKKKSFEFLSLLFEKKEIIYIDEVSFASKVAPNYAYSKRGSIRKFFVKSNSANITAIVAFTAKGVLGLQLLTGNNKGEDFACFLIGLLKSHPIIKSNLEKYCLFMDNCSIHTKSTIKKMISRLSVHFNAPHSPFYNPIENVFGLVKYSYRKKQVRNPSIRSQNILDSFLEVEEETSFRIVRRAIKMAWRTIIGEKVDA